MGRFRKKIWVLLFIIFLQATLGIVGGISAAGYYYGSRIMPGVDVARISLDGLTYAEARDELGSKLALPPSLNLVWKEQSFSVPLHPGIGQFNMDAVFQQTLKMSDFPKAGPIFFNAVRWIPLATSLDIPLIVSESYLLRELEKIKKEVDREPEDARLIIEEGVPIVLEEKSGRTLDLLQSVKTVEEHLHKGQFTGIPLKVTETPPEVAREDLPDFSALIAAFSTSLDGSSEDRRHNIMLATEEIHGTIMEPGEIFSFNEQVGPVTAEQGYRKVLVIQNRTFVPGIGGGICQVATTLYQIALRGELEIVQRTPHSRPVSYVPLGQDATVAQGLIDLKILNNKDFPVIITGLTDESSLSLFLYGAEQEAGRNVDIVSEDVEVLTPRLLEQPDPSLPKGVRQQVQEGEDGYRVSVYRLVNKNGVTINRELISTDVYKPVNEVVKVGTREVVKANK